MVDAILSHLIQWIIDCVEKCQGAIFMEGQGDVYSIIINNYDLVMFCWHKEKHFLGKVLGNKSVI